MRYKVIWIMAGMIALWMGVMGGTIALDFDRVQQSNQATVELEWAFICDGDNGEYVEIDVIDGGENFIGRTRDDMENTIIDAKGRALSDTYDSLEPLGDGYVRFENTPDGVVITGEDGKNKRTVIGVLDEEGNQLPEEEALAILEGTAESVDNGSRGGDPSGDGTQAGAAGYRVTKGERKYVGIRDSADHWVLPPVFHEIAISTGGQYAVIQNGPNVGIAVLGE